MTRFRVDVTKDTGEVMLNMETGCGVRPILGWTNADGMKEFAQMLLGLYDNIEIRKQALEITSEYPPGLFKDFEYVPRGQNN